MGDEHVTGELTMGYSSEDALEQYCIAYKSQYPCPLLVSASVPG